MCSSTTPTTTIQRQELPRLPVPDLERTLRRYLDSLRAVLAPADGGRPVGCQLTEEQLEANRKQFELTEQLVSQFKFNEGPQLQRDLKEFANRCQNWVSCCCCCCWALGLSWLSQRLRFGGGPIGGFASGSPLA